jgi:hypothetical protein
VPVLLAVVVAEPVLVAVDVLLAVVVAEPDAVPVGVLLEVVLTLAHAEPEGVSLPVAHAEGVFEPLPLTEAEELADADAVALGEAEGVLDAGALRKPVAQPVGLVLDVVVAVAVFDGGAVREPVAHADAVRVADMVRVPEGEPEGDFDAEMEPVTVAACAGEPVRLPASEKEGEPVAVLDAVMLREPAGDAGPASARAAATAASRSSAAAPVGAGSAKAGDVIEKKADSTALSTTRTWYALVEGRPARMVHHRSTPWRKMGPRAEPARSAAGGGARGPAPAAGGDSCAYSPGASAAVGTPLPGRCSGAREKLA